MHGLREPPSSAWQIIHYGLKFIEPQALKNPEIANLAKPLHAVEASAAHADASVTNVLAIELPIRGIRRTVLDISAVTRITDDGCLGN